MEPQKQSILHITLLSILGILIMVFIALVLFTLRWNIGTEVVLEENPAPVYEEIPDMELVADAKARGQFHFVPNSAVASTVLDVTDCKPNPDVLEVTLGEELVIQNNGDEEVTLQLNAKDYVVPAQGQVAITTDFGKGAMAYGYSCSLKTQMVGVIVVTE